MVGVQPHVLGESCSAFLFSGLSPTSVRDVIWWMDWWVLSGCVPFPSSRFLKVSGRDFRDEAGRFRQIGCPALGHEHLHIQLP